jgi:voltage-gated sodium channel
MYFTGHDWHWNWFDFIIVVLSTPGVELDSLPYVLRLLRLARVLKLLSRYQQLRVILAGLAAGLKSSVWIVVLLLLVFYMFAVGFLMYFSGNDPRHFDNFVHTFATLFRMSTGEDWTDVTYVNWYGCTNYAMGGGVDYWTNSSGVTDPIASGYMFGTWTNASGVTFGQQYIEDETYSPARPWSPSADFPFFTECKGNSPLPFTALLGSIIFMFFSSFIVLSMFIGSIAIAMTGLMEDMAKIQADALASKIATGTAMEEPCSSDSTLDDKLVTLERIKDLPLSGRIRFTSIQESVIYACTGVDPHKSFLLDELAKMTCTYDALLPAKKIYFTYAYAIRSLTKEPHFNQGIEATIMVAAVLVGLQTDGWLDGYNVGWIDTVISIIFLFEAVTKIIGEIFRPWRYFDDAWNRFDFFIVVASFMPVDSGPVIALRLLRLLRVLKLMKAMPQLQVLTEALEKTANSIIWIMVLLLLFFYIAAIVGIMLFQENDPWHFGNIHLALMALFRISTLEDWTDIMYINELGCDKWDAFPYVEFGFSSHACKTPVASGYLALGFFIGFVAFSNYVLLSLFIGIIAAEMESSQREQVKARELNYQVQCYCKDNFGSKWKKRLFHFEQAYELCNEIRPTDGIDLEVIQLVLQVMKEDADAKHIKDWFDTNAVRPPDGQLNLYDFTYFLDNMPWKKENQGANKKDALDLEKVAAQQQAESDALHKKGKDKQTHYEPPWAKKLQAIVNDGRFESFILGVVIFGGMVVGIQIGYQPLHSDWPAKELAVFGAIDTIILVIFIIEAVMKMLQYPLEPWMYLVTFTGWRVPIVHTKITVGANPWNCFDFMLIILSLPGVMGSAAGALRLLRLARLIKIINKVPKMKVIVEGLMAGLESVLYIMVLMLLVFYFYAVCGVSLFSANDPFHFANIPLAFETLFRCATLEDWTDVWYINYHGCGNYHMDIYTTNATIAANSIYPRYFLCVTERQPWIATFFFISFIWIASFILLSLFVGSILISTMDAVMKIAEAVKEAEKLKRDAVKQAAMLDFHSLEQRLRRQKVMRNILCAWKKSERLTTFGTAQEKRIVDLAAQYPDKFISPHEDLNTKEVLKMNPLSATFFGVALLAEKIRDNTGFCTFINVCILVASLMVGVQATCPPDDGGACEAQFAIPDMALTIIFLVEVIAKMLAEKFHTLRYFNDPWNRLDFVVVSCSFVPAIGSFALVVRMVRLLRVLKVLRVIPELRMLVTALVSAQESVMYVSVLMFLFFYMVAIFAMIVYRDNDTFHFGTLHQSLFSLFRIATGEDWTDIMYTAQYGCDIYPVPHTFKKSQFMTSQDAPLSTGFYDCLNPTAHKASAVFFFVWFHMIGGLVFLNLFIGVVTVGMGDAIEQQEKEKVVLNELKYMMQSEADGGMGLNKEQEDGYRKAFDITDLTDGLVIDEDDFTWVLNCVYLDPTVEEMRYLVDAVNKEMETSKKERYAQLEGAVEVTDDPQATEALAEHEAAIEADEEAEEWRNDKEMESLNDEGRSEFTLHEFISVLDHHTIEHIKVTTAHRTDFSVRGDRPGSPAKSRTEERVVTVQKNKVIV